MSVNFKFFPLQVEVVGTLDGGIDAACWSPDQELLILVTGAKKVVLLSSLFVPILEFSLDGESFGESEFINVGWGKKETQFHGTEGKDARTKGPVVGGVAEVDDYKPRISWRGDGQLFVVSFIETPADDEPRRRLKIVSREGAVQYTSEVVTKLEHSLSWRPSGSTIASSQKLPSGKYNIVFFERNGLRHGEFLLQAPDPYFVKDIIWNGDSTVLLVWLSNSNSKPDYIQLWTSSNYTWHLKEEFIIENPQSVFWDMDSALKLHVVTTSTILAFSLSFCIDRSLGLSASDMTVVSVVSGDKLLSTPFRKSNIPPPMAAFSVKFEGQVRDVAFPSWHEKSASCNDVCVLHGNYLSLMTLTENLEHLNGERCTVDYILNRSPKFKVTFPVHKSMKEFDLTNVLSEIGLPSGRLSNLVWCTESTFYALAHDFSGSSDSLLLLNVSSEEVTCKKIATPSVPFLKGCGYNGCLFLQCLDGTLFQLLSPSSDLVAVLDKDGIPVKFSSPCIEMACVSIESQISVLGLSSRNRLYWNNTQLSSNCSSFLVHREHLLLTTTAHKLCVIPLTIEAMAAFVAGDFTFCGQRNLERGSKLVATVAEDCRVILQMPRGNLETVYPRPLMVHFLKKCLDSREYKKAVDLMRKHRIDMNLLYDHNPRDFSEYCTEIVKNVNNPAWLDLFIAGLKEEDVTKTLFSFNYSGADDLTAIKGDVSKIDYVCTLLRNAMTEVDENRFLLPILTSFVKMDGSQMDTALKKVKSLKDNPVGEISAEEGLRHLLYIADADVLCDVAIGTYDFDLVMMVFKKSQKDPKEFLPFLNNLRKMETRYMKYSINIYLKKYRKAFHEIKDTGSDHLEECLAVVKKEKVFSVALEEFPKGSDLYKAVAECYGDYNLGKGYYGEAALLYERADKLVDALHAYQQSGNWRKAFITAAKLNYSNNQMLEMYYSTIEQLKERKKFIEASIIYKDYIKSEEDAIDCLVLAHQWDEALRLAYQNSRLDLVETNLLPELLKQARHSLSEIETMKGSLTSLCDRLQSARESIKTEQQDIMDGKEVFDADMYCDSTSTITDTSNAGKSRSRSTTGSSASGRTYRSAKNRKKLERKKYSTKEGSIFEDLGLMTEIHSLFVRADSLAEPTGAIVASLYSFQHDALALSLQRSLHDLLRLIEKREREVWPNESVDNEAEGQFNAGMSTAELIKAKQEGQRDFLQERLKHLDPALRHAPKLTRPSNWALGFLQKKSDL